METMKTCVSNISWYRGYRPQDQKVKYIYNNSL